MQRLVLLLFGLILAVVPVPLASNREWAWSPLAVAVGVLLFLCALTIARKPEVYRRTLANSRSLLVPSTLTGIAILWGLLQASELTPESWANPLFATSVLGVSAKARSVALDHEAVFVGVMRLLINAGIFYVAALLASSVSNARRLLGTIIIVAGLTTLYAMVAQVVNHQSARTGVWIWTPHEPYFSGTFVNPNNYATYAGVAAIGALSLALRPRRFLDPQENVGQRWRRRLAAFSSMPGFWFAIALILMTGVLFSESRAGWISLVLALTLMGALYSRGIIRAVWLVLAPLSLAGMTLLLPGGAGLVSRMTQLAQGDESRETLYAMTVQAIGRNPLTGWGLNSFQYLYPVFQPPNLPVNYDKVHNTYLELVFDLGVPAAGALLVAILWIVGQCAVGFFRRGRDAELAGAGVVTAALVGFHALFDFSLQIPAMAATFFAILGIAWAQSWPTAERRSSLQ